MVVDEDVSRVGIHGVDVIFGILLGFCRGFSPISTCIPSANGRCDVRQLQSVLERPENFPSVSHYFRDFEVSSI